MYRPNVKSKVQSLFESRKLKSDEHHFFFNFRRVLLCWRDVPGERVVSFFLSNARVTPKGKGRKRRNLLQTTRQRRTTHEREPTNPTPPKKKGRKEGQHHGGLFSLVHHHYWIALAIGWWRLWVHPWQNGQLMHWIHVTLLQSIHDRK